MGSHRNNFMIWTYNNNHKPVWRQYQYVRMHIGVNLWGLRPSWSTIRHIIRHFYAGSQPQSARTHVAVKSELEPASITTLQHNTTGRIWLALCTLALQLFAMFNLQLFARYRVCNQRWAAFAHSSFSSWFYFHITCNTFSWIFITIVTIAVFSAGYNTVIISFMNAVIIITATFWFWRWQSGIGIKHKAWVSNLCTNYRKRSHGKSGQKGHVDTYWLAFTDQRTFK